MERSISGSGTAPSGIDDWLTDANEALTAVEAATQDAENAAEHQPKINTSGYWEIWDAETGAYVATTVKAQGDKGDPGDPGSPGDPTELIDDTAGEGDTGKTWSADKLDDQFGGVLTAIQGIHQIPSGGSSGQVLGKASGSDFDLEWKTVSGSGTVDSSLSTSSENPVQNKVITNEIKNVEKTLTDCIVTKNISKGFLKSNGNVNVDYATSEGRLYKYIIPSGLTKIYISGTLTFDVTTPYWCALWFVQSNSMMDNGYIACTSKPITWDMYEVTIPENAEEIWADKNIRIFTSADIDKDITARLSFIENNQASFRKRLVEAYEGSGQSVISYDEFSITSSNVTYTLDNTEKSITVSTSSSPNYANIGIGETLFKSRIVAGKRYRLHVKAERISGTQPMAVAIVGTKSNASQWSARIYLENKEDNILDFIADLYMHDIRLFITTNDGRPASAKFSEIWIEEYNTEEIGLQWFGKKWYGYGTSITNTSSEGKYPNYLKRLSGLNYVNKGISGGGIGNLGAYSQGQVYSAICNTSDGKTEADLITLETGANDCNESVPLGTIYDTGTETLAGCLNDCIRYLQANTNAQICIMTSPATTTEPNATNQYYEWADMVEKICHLNRVHFIRNDNNMGYAKLADATKGSLYVSDNIHQTNLGGYIMAENIWYQLRNIPCFRTELP